MIRINDHDYTIKKFPDGTLNMTDCAYPSNADIRPITISWYFESVEEQVVLYNLVKHMRNVSGATAIILILPYVPNARMDRVKNPLKETPTLKYFCEFINDLKFDRVVVTDVHSPVTLTLLDRVLEMDVEDYIRELTDSIEPDYFFFPDKGAYERYEYLTIRTPFFGEKIRDWTTGDIKGLKVINPYDIKPEDWMGKSILIIDDISSYGGTFFHSGNKLKDMGFGDIYLYVTHAENTILQGQLVKPDSCIKHIYTTDTIFTGKHDKITVIR